MHDPFQNYQALGAGSIGASPYGTPYAAQTPGYPAGIPQIPGLNPFAAGLHNLLLQNPLLQNPLVQQALWHQAIQQQALQQQALQQNPLLNAYSQPQQFSYPLAPQSLIGQGQFGATPFGAQVYGQPQQIHPMVLQQLALRSLASSGITPWAGI